MKTLLRKEKEIKSNFLREDLMTRDIAKQSEGKDGLCYFKNHTSINI